MGGERLPAARRTERAAVAANVAGRSFQPNGRSMGKRPEQPAPSLVKRGPDVGHASYFADGLKPKVAC